MKKAHLFFLCICPLFTIICQGQLPISDSLVRELQSAKEDTNKVNILNQLSELLTDDEIVLEYAQQALHLSQTLKHDKGIAVSCKNLAWAYKKQSNAPQALEYYKKSLTAYEKTGDKYAIAEALNIIGVYHDEQGDASRALFYYRKGLQIGEEAGNKEAIAHSLQNIGFTYHNLGDISEALAYYYKSLKIWEELGDNEETAEVLNNIGLLYGYQKDYASALENYTKCIKIYEGAGNKRGTAQIFNSIGSNYQLQGDIKNAFIYLKKSLAILEEIGDELMGIGYVLNNIGGIYFRLDSFSLSLGYYQRSLKIREKIGDKQGITATLKNIAQLYLKQKNYRQAETYASRSLEIAKEIGFPTAIRNASDIASQTYFAAGKYRQAYEAQVLFKTMADSVINMETKKAVFKSQVQYDFDKREALAKAEQVKKEVIAKAEISRQTLIRNYTFGGVGLAGVFSFLLFRSFVRRRKVAFERQVSEVEMKALRAQMNPHFIFNSLHSINKYVMDNDKSNASYYLSKFARLMRLILENSREQEVLLKDDLATLELYMQLEALRFQNRFDYQIDVDPQIDSENTVIPPMLLQPFVENAILHGLSSKEGGHIQIRVHKEDEMLRCTVEDNGTGRQHSLSVEAGGEKKRQSLGMKITEDRLHIINQLKKAKAAVEVIDLKDTNHQASGVRIEVTLPYQLAF